MIWWLINANNNFLIWTGSCHRPLQQEMLMLNPIIVFAHPGKPKEELKVPCIVLVYKSIKVLCFTHWAYPSLFRIHIYWLMVFFSAFGGALLYISVHYFHLYISGMVWNYLQESESYPYHGVGDKTNGDLLIRKPLCI